MNKIKILWFETTMPSRYEHSGIVGGGWQDSLENIVKSCPEIQLHIAFESHKYTDAKCVDGVWYYPMNFKYSLTEKIIDQFSWNPNCNHIVAEELKIIDKVKPDLIHIFGNEWAFGMIQKYTKIPCVIHIQGSWISHFNSLYPPKYNGFTISKAIGLDLRKQWRLYRSYYKDLSRLNMETEIWKSVSNYMGRTEWDRALVNTLSPMAKYYHVEEALRPVFLESSKKWCLSTSKVINIISVGCSSFLKGIDMMLKTANVLKNMGVDFTWKVAGQLDPLMKKAVENKEHLKFSDCNIEILGYVTAEQLAKILTDSSIYVHTAYIENSPNSICEAQVLGLPIISTHVGGIATLVEDKKGGLLIPANEPWQMANAIVELFEDKARMQSYSKYNMDQARKRHSVDNVKQELLACYKDIIKRNV